jgi:hypothetical protein
MKPWAITILAVVGGYAVIQWLMHQRGTAQGQRATAAFNLNLGPLGVAAGINSNVDPTASGVPGFNTAPIANGHGDQVAAAYHSNPSSTINGGFQYSPAFGPNENQASVNEVSAGL